MNMNEEIKQATDRLIQAAGPEVLDQLKKLTGVSGQAVYNYSTGARSPDRFLLWYVFYNAGDNIPLLAWAGECLDIRARYGEGLPAWEGWEKVWASCVVEVEQ